MSKSTIDYKAYRQGWVSFEMSDGKPNPYDFFDRRDEFTAFVNGYNDSKAFAKGKEQPISA